MLLLVLLVTITLMATAVLLAALLTKYLWPMTFKLVPLKYQ